MRKVTLIAISAFLLCLRAYAQDISVPDAPTVAALSVQPVALLTPSLVSSCLVCRNSQYVAKAVALPQDGLDRHGRFHPPQKSDYWSKIRNFYKPNGDEAGDREGFNVHEIGRKQIYFGIALGVNAANYRITHKPFLGINDTIKGMKPVIGPGFNLGIIANWQFHKYFDLRIIPTLSFSDKSIQYSTILRKTPSVNQTVSSIYLDFPLQIRFKSQPIGNVRLYVIGGGRYDYDLASNSSTRAQTLLKVGKNDVSVDYGAGIMIYFPYFIMSPEFKVSQGVINVNSPVNGYVYSRAIEKLYSRTYTFTLNLEG